MKSFNESKQVLVNKGIYRNAIKTDHTNERIYITIPYGSLKNSGQTKVYKRPTNLNFERIVKFWFNSVDKNKTYSY